MAFHLAVTPYHPSDLLLPLTSASLRTGMDSDGQPKDRETVILPVPCGISTGLDGDEREALRIFPQSLRNLRKTPPMLRSKCAA